MTCDFVDIQIKCLELVLYLLKADVEMHRKLEIMNSPGEKVLEKRIETAFARIGEIKEMICSCTKYLDESVEMMKTSAGDTKNDYFQSMYAEEKKELTKLLKYMKASHFEYDMYLNGYREFDTPPSDDVATSRYNHKSEAHEDVDLSKRLIMQ